jgi:transcriptional regulator with XRE-family HTH domain
MAAVNRGLLKDARDRMDLSNRELAELVQISPAYLDNVLCGADEPSMRLVYRFSRALNIPPEQIVLTEAEPAKEPTKQPSKDPSAPPRRTDTEGTRTGPKRADAERVA